MKHHYDKYNSCLSDKGLKCTKERQEILREISCSRNHFEAENFLRQLNSKGLKISRPTFYRTLKLFINAGLIGKSNLEDGRVIYENMIHGDHHDHFVCTDCGKMIEFYDRYLERQQDRICKKIKFLGIRHQIQIFGLCSSCQPSDKSYKINNRKRKIKS